RSETTDAVERPRLETLSFCSGGDRRTGDLVSADCQGVNQNPDGQRTGSEEEIRNGESRLVGPCQIDGSEERAQTQEIEHRGDKRECEGNRAKFSQRHSGHTLGSPEEVETESDQDGDAGRGVNEEPQGERQVYNHARAS